MASLRIIRNRIRSVRNTQKITKAMKMLAAAKLRKAQDAVIRARPYAQLIEEMLASLAEARAREELPPHPLMAVRPERRVEVVMLTSDRGLAGGFNSNIIRRGQRFMTEESGRLERRSAALRPARTTSDSSEGSPTGRRARSPTT